jgi:hypothetical protein
MLEHLSPETVETLAQIVFGVIVLLASALGINLGLRRKNSGDDQELHEIKGAIISDAKAHEIMRFMEENTRSNMELVAAIHLLREGVKDAKQDIKDIMREFKEDMRYMLQSSRR